MKRTFSIVIPTYNGERYVSHAIESALNQTRKPDEIIVSDDNSKDKTLTIAKSYESLGVVTICNTSGPSGFVRGWNNAIKHASCEFISILHQDDILYPDFLKCMDELLSEFPEARHAFVPCDYIDEQGTIIKGGYRCSTEKQLYNMHEYISAYMDCGNGMHIHRCPGVVTHRDLFSKCSYREEAGHIADDDFFYRIGQYTEVAGFLAPLSAYREHNQSETGKLNDKLLVRRLVQDYSFQVTDPQSISVFSASEYKYIKKLYNKYSKRLLGYSLVTADIKNIFFALFHILRCRTL